MADSGDAGHTGSAVATQSASGAKRGSPSPSGTPVLDRSKGPRVGRRQGAASRGAGRVEVPQPSSQPLQPSDNAEDITMAMGAATVASDQSIPVGLSAAGSPIRAHALDMHHPHATDSSHVPLGSEPVLTPQTDP